MMERLPAPSLGLRRGTQQAGHRSPFQHHGQEPAPAVGGAHPPREPWKPAVGSKAPPSSLGRAGGLPHHTPGCDLSSRHPRH